ncbi:DUF4397 domain-containing protein [Demequina muriae]|uniref:DUF4397 domain-containing protein n=1 Tax=Demequina muriae TaxID=3051664 RepID=A0ABT8GH34_9MICO|nr:DUF4397 domain-containing protein [Demequina sp. EGI L300058]MDN4480730.1 DUF4397 domain-containing protein [Demequina sp. EGI L300058]
MRKSAIAGVAAGALIAVGAAAPALAVEDGMTELSVLHGIPDTPVDVYVNGTNTIDDFQPGDLAGPLDLEPGTYTVALTATDAADDSEPVLGPIDITLEEGMSYTAVAHLTAEGDPGVNLFTNDISETAAGEGRLTVRHTAAAPAVDVWADGAVLFENLSNPDEVSGDVPAATYEAAVSLTGETDPVLGPTDVEIADGVNTIVYAWGSAEAGNLDLAVQTVDTHASSPSEVAAGTQGLAADRGVPAGAIAAILLAFALAAAAAGRMVTARR